MENLSDLTVLIPLRLDSKSREENLDSVVEYFHRNTLSHVIILEADRQSRYILKKNYPRISLHFYPDDDPVFYRTRHLNQLLKMAQTPIAALWDTDVIVPVGQISEAARQIRTEGSLLALPFNGCCYAVSDPWLRQFKNEIDIEVLTKNLAQFQLVYAHLCVGGAILVNRTEYLKAGGENEHFYGWGPEDAERVKRLEILEKKIFQGEGPLFHLNHPRGKNSNYISQQTELNNRKELFKICSMHKNELERYIEEWQT